MKPLFKRTLGDENDKLVFLLASFGGIFLIILTRIIGDAVFDSNIISIWDYLAVFIAVLITFPPNLL